MAQAGLQRARTSVGQTVLARGGERAHEIAVADPPGRRLASLRRELLEKAGDIADVPDVDLGGTQPAARERVPEQPDDFGVGESTLRSNELDARLVVFALGAAHRRLLAEDGREIREAKYRVAPPIALGDDARDGRRDVGPEREQASVAVQEAQHAALVKGQCSGRELDGGRLQRDVAVRRERPHEQALDGVQLARLGREDVAEAPRDREAVRNVGHRLSFGIATRGATDSRDTGPPDGGDFAPSPDAGMRRPGPETNVRGGTRGGRWTTDPR